MYLKSLELTGFKSFAKKATLSFNSAITGIVGPNGSGKSNVAEAFRFVLGEQSIKSLRGKRGEDLIWNGGGEGSSNAGRANRGSIKLTFDNSTRMFKDVDFDEVTIERIVNRDNANEYLMNGSQVRLKDIVELLASAHIGATGHHIISQGEADRILSASIRERREMIEDALGLKIYQWKKLESLRKLEKTEENMKQVESLRREIAPHIKFLKKQVEKVEKGIEMRTELIALYKEYFASESAYIEIEKGRLNHELAGPKKELAELDKQLAKARDTLTASKNGDEKSADIISLEKELSELRTEKDSVTRELGRLEGEISANTRAIEKEKEKQKKDEFKTIYLKDLEEVVSTIEGFKSLDDAKKLFNDILTTLKGFISKHRSITDSAFIGETEAETSKLLKEKSKLEESLKSLDEKESNSNRKYNELKKNIEKEKDTNREAEKDVFKIIAEQNELRGSIAALSTKLDVVLHDEEAFKRELGEAGSIVGREATDYESEDVKTSPARARGARHPLAKGESEALREFPLGEGAVERSETGGMLIDSRTVQEERRKKIEKIKVRLEDAGIGGGAEVMKEYKETEERDTFLARELEDLNKAEKELQELITELDTRIDVEFKTGITKINAEFQKFFVLMFGGGKAELSLVKEPRRTRRGNDEGLNELLNSDGSDSLEQPTEDGEEGPEGLEVNVSLPRKKVKGLMMLSGGERALTSIALLFAVSQVNPPPFIILDETDAALDEANSKKYSDMIENLSARSQLILITDNRETMSRAGTLYGVTMGADGASKLLSIAFEEAVKVAK